MYQNLRRAMLALSPLCIFVYGPSEAHATCSVGFSQGGTVATCSGTTSNGGPCSWHGLNGMLSCERHAGVGPVTKVIRVTPAMREQIQAQQGAN